MHTPGTSKTDIANRTQARHWVTQSTQSRRRNTDTRVGTDDNAVICTHRTGTGMHSTWCVVAYTNINANIYPRQHKRTLVSPRYWKNADTYTHRQKIKYINAHTIPSQLWVHCSITETIKANHYANMIWFFFTVVHPEAVVCTCSSTRSSHGATQASSCATCTSTSTPAPRAGIFNLFSETS